VKSSPLKKLRMGEIYLLKNIKILYDEFLV
jgi:hypothetical protein